MSVDLDKIQGVIETEISKATTTERKRIIGLVKDFTKDLVSAINTDDDDVVEEVVPTKKPAAKKPAAKKPATKKPEAAEEEQEEENDGPIDGSQYDIDEVEDDEVDESEYAGKKVAELRAICKERDITVPKGYKQLDIAKMLILDDEENEG